MSNTAQIAIVMGSKSDWATMQEATQILDELNVAYHVEVVSAHRTPDKLFEFAENAQKNGYKVIIAGAGGAAHLPGMIAAKTLVPVLGVPVKSSMLSGVDSLYSIVQMPKGIPVGTLAIGPAGAANAGLLAAQIAIVMGSKSDWATMQEATQILDELNVAYHVEVVSAHRTPDKLFEFAENAQKNGYKVIIAGAGGAAHLPGMIAAKTLVPVLGVPVKSSMLSGVDSLYSIVQMPKGIPVGTLAIGPAGAANAGLLAAQILAGWDNALFARLQAFRENQTNVVLDNPDPRE